MAPDSARRLYGAAETSSTKEPGILSPGRAHFAGRRRGLRRSRYRSRVTAADEPARSDTDSADGGPASPRDPSRRTWLAAERTWLAWWRTGLGAAAVAIGVGRILPGFTGGSRLPMKLLGLAYGVLAVAILTIGAVRQARVAEALRRGSHEELSSPLVAWLTAGGVALALATLVLIAVAF